MELLKRWVLLLFHREPRISSIVLSSLSDRILLPSCSPRSQMLFFSWLQTTPLMLMVSFYPLMVDFLPVILSCLASRSNQQYRVEKSRLLGDTHVVRISAAFWTAGSRKSRCKFVHRKQSDSIKTDVLWRTVHFPFERSAVGPDWIWCESSLY